MRTPRQITCGVFWLVLIILFSQGPARAEVSLVVSGISVINANNITQAEKDAYNDAVYKAYLELALRHTPASCAPDLVQKLKGFVSSRGSQDIVQYQIVSRSQQDGILYVNLDLKINDGPLKEWLQLYAFTTPLGMRPLILIAVAVRGPGPSERHEWWTTPSPKGYSLFETQLAQRLRNAGENVADVPSRIVVLTSGPDKISSLAANLGASLLIAGSVTYKNIDASTVDARLDLSLIDVKIRQKLSVSILSLRGTADLRTMNEMLITALLEQFRSEIAKEVTIIRPALHHKELCINEIRDYDTYQSLINSLRSLDTVTRISVSRIHEHSICHTLQIRGSLKDVMDCLKQKQAVKADMLVEDNTASIQILSQ